MSGCPVRYTCPKIDTVIAQCQLLRDRVDQLLKGEFEWGGSLLDQLKLIEEARNNFQPFDLLEELRENNEDLRSWGEEQENDAAWLRQEAELLEEKFVEQPMRPD